MIKKEIDIRIEEIAFLKKNCTFVNISSQRTEIIRKYTPVSIYAVFEGFLISSMEIFINEINLLQLKMNELRTSIINRELEINYNLYEKRVNIESKHRLVQALANFFEEEDILLSNSFITEGNINLKVINNIFKIYGVKPIKDEVLDKGLNKLLKYRNAIAHGERDLRVDNENINEFSKTVINGMDLIYEHIVSGFESKCFCR